MSSQWEPYESALRSGDSNRVNDVVEEIKDMDVLERVELFEECFERVTELYETHDDGYVRQSCVRVVEQLPPKFTAVVNLQSPEVESPPVKTISEQTDAACGFLLDALTDEDGRVRQSAQRALENTVRTYDALDDTAAIEALIDELETMAANADGTHRKHLLEAKNDAEFFMQSGIGRMIQGLEEQLDDEIDS